MPFLTSRPVAEVFAVRDATAVMAGETPEAPTAVTERDEEARAAALRLDEHLVSLRAPDSFEADQYRVLRHFLQTGTEGDTLRVIGVTSPAAGDGKTTTAINLAATLAQSPDVRVLLIDTDLRRPCVGSSLGLGASGGPGLAAAVVDPRLDLAAVTRPTPFNLHVVPAGSASRNAYLILESPRVGQLLEEARRSYDYVILDTPPLLLVPDCRLLAERVDAFIMVVAARQTPRKLLAEAISAMEPGKLAGVVFNRDDRPLSGYYKGHYAGYYGDRARPRGRGWLGWWRRDEPEGRKSWR